MTHYRITGVCMYIPQAPLSSDCSSFTIVYKEYKGGKVAVLGIVVLQCVIGGRLNNKQTSFYINKVHLLYIKKCAVCVYNSSEEG